MFLAGFVLGFLIFYVFSPLIFKTQLCCGPNGKEIGKWLNYYHLTEKANTNDLHGEGCGGGGLIFSRGGGGRVIKRF